MNAKIPFKTLRYVTLPVATAGFVLFASPSISEASSFETLNQGDEGKNVEEIQELLSEQGFFQDEINGTYTFETAEAVKAFQQKHELAQDGIAGTQTVGALHTLAEGDEGELVEDLQGQLIELGFLNGGHDGIFGPNTEEAVKSFQADHHLSVDGIAGPKTFKELYYITEEQVVEQKTETKAEEVTAEPEAQETTTEQEQPQQEQQEETASEEAEPQQEEPQQEESQQESSEEPAESAEPQSEPAQEEASAQSEESSETSQTEGTTLQVEATAYTANCTGCTGVTATGIDLNKNPNQKVIAVDPSVIPLGSRVHVEGYGEAIAGDTGGAINGNKVDLYMQSHSDAIAFGRQTINVTILD
ncbi:peptidoglycan-binding protein [Alkalicoccobacillus murimartini]|uniref:3D (Asp-Asp-Asp) domain-containing protein n=1 Tax=Alkalicoccobacillus murimartini TaxID=171685 RepID=A0ABT9YER9_9BACI|nr:peptidoglycan-binding protein [Alkalicoccobacillus murimartini]MDQ0206113.1 3D (Asp-Asp-Asp) domain-containing protein [Alkalicoccobacillus murimartini]